jgi:hypothetical protein
MGLLGKAWACAFRAVNRDPATPRLKIKLGMMEEVIFERLVLAMGLNFKRVKVVMLIALLSEETHRIFEFNNFYHRIFPCSMSLWQCLLAMSFRLRTPLNISGFNSESLEFTKPSLPCHSFLLCF